MGKSLNRMRCEVFQSDFVSVAGFDFQACSFNHSDISPFRINSLRALPLSSLAIVISPRKVTRCSSIALPEITPSTSDSGIAFRETLTTPRGRSRTSDIVIRGHTPVLLKEEAGAGDIRLRASSKTTT